MAARGELNVGAALPAASSATRPTRSASARTRGTVAAASYWDGPMEVKTVRPSDPSELRARVPRVGRSPAFLLPLREPRPSSASELGAPRLERAIGVIYRPGDGAREPLLPGRAAAPVRRVRLVRPDSRAVQPLETKELAGMPETYPVRPLSTSTSETATESFRLSPGGARADTGAARRHGARTPGDAPRGGRVGGDDHADEPRRDGRRDRVRGDLPAPGGPGGLRARDERPVAEDGLLGVRPVVTATLSADHRASDGQRGARFLAAVARSLRNPEEA